MSRTASKLCRTLGPSREEHEALGAKGELLAPHTERGRGELSDRQTEVSEELVEIELVLIDRSRLGLLAVLEARLELDKEPCVRDVEIAVEEVALEERAIGVLGTSPPEGVVEVLVPEACAPAQ